MGPFPKRAVAVVSLLLLLLGGGFVNVVRAARKSIKVVADVAGRPKIPSGSAPQFNQLPYQGRGAAMRPGGGITGAGPTGVQPGGCDLNDVLAVTFEVPKEGSDGRIYGNLVSYGLTQIHGEDYFEYEIMWRDSDCNCGAEFEIGAEYRLRDHGPRDSKGYSPHSERNANMSAVATMAWYHRRWDVGDLASKFADKWVFSAKLQPGSRRVAYFRYIRLVRPSNPEGGKKVWVPGMPPITIGSYFPGTITTSCQPTTLVTAEQATFTDIVPGRPVRFSAILTASLLSEQSGAASSAGALTSRYAVNVLEELQWLRHEQSTSKTKLHNSSLRLRHRHFPSVTLWSVHEEAFERGVKLPRPFSAGFVAPPASPLTEILAFGQWELNLTTSTEGVDGLRESNVLLADARYVLPAS